MSTEREPGDEKQYIDDVLDAIKRERKFALGLEGIQRVLASAALGVGAYAVFTHFGNDRLGFVVGTASALGIFLLGGARSSGDNATALRVVAALLETEQSADEAAPNHTRHAPEWHEPHG